MKLGDLSRRCCALRPADRAGAANTSPAPWRRPRQLGRSGIAAQSGTPGHGWPCRGRCESKGRRCSARRAWAPNQETEGIYRRPGKERRSGSTTERGARTPVQKGRTQKQARSTRWGARENFFPAHGRFRAGRPADQKPQDRKVQSSSDAMGLGALAVRCQRKARMCCQQSMDLAAVHNTIAAINVLEI